MFVLYYKRLYIVPEPLTKNRTHQSWRGEQVAVCNDKELLEEYVRSKPEKVRDLYYIEERPWQQTDDRKKV